MKLGIRTREQLLAWICQHTYSPATKRLLTTGCDMEVLGSFASVGIVERPGWVVKIVSPSKKKWYVIVFVCDRVYRLHVPYGNYNVPWEHWDGDKSKNKLYTGDNPDIYRRLRDETKSS